MKRIVIILFFIGFLSCETTKKSSSTIMTKEANLLKSKEEGYFKAVGKDSMWILEISELQIRFKNSQQQIDFTALHVEPIRAADANIKLYTVQSGDENVQISIYAQSCEDYNNQKSDYKVEIKWKKGFNSEEELFSGCGKYSIDYRLYDNWVLESLEGKELDRTLFQNNMPSIEINSSTKKISGFSGCNRFNGSIFQERDLLRFTQIISTKMACNNLTFETTYFKVIQQSTGYKIKYNRLFLTQSDQVIAVFRKID